MASPEITGYKILKTLGTGGFASVYLATELDRDRRVAIKVLHAHTSNASDLRRFEREASTMRAFDGHPNIVRVFDTGETPDGAHYTVLELVSGGSVREMLRDQGAMEWSEVLRIGVQVCSALDVAHRSGVLHRDVKPGNILLEDNEVKLSDFGIARLVGQSQVTAAQSIIGTLAYTPPEIFHNNPFDGRGDIYQLGVMMYEMLLGRAPFTSAAAENKAAIIRRIIDKPAPPLAQFDIPEPISDFLDEVLAKDPADRPQTAERFAERLNDIERELGRPPTVMHRYESAAMDETIAVDSVATQGAIETIQAPTMPISMEFDDTGDIDGTANEIDSEIDGEIDGDPTDSEVSDDRVSDDEFAVDDDSGDDPAGDSGAEWPAAASIPLADAAAAVAIGSDSTPTPPVIKPPDDANQTVVQPRPEITTEVIPKPKQESLNSTAAKLKAASAKQRTDLDAPRTTGPKIAAAKASAPKNAAPTNNVSVKPPETPSAIYAAEPEKGRAPWLLLLLGFLIVAGAGVVFAFTQLSDANEDERAASPEGVGADVLPTDEGTEETPTEDTIDEPEQAPAFVAVDDAVFTDPLGEAGVIFDSVANSQGLTMVGAIGDGDSLSEQRSVVWTLGNDGFALRRDLNESGTHRMRSIGVNRQTFLAVGSTPGADDNAPPDGLAWTGGQASQFAPVTNSDFTGDADDRLLVATLDSAQDPNFLVGGSRSADGTAIAQIWEVSPEPSWAEPTWTRVNMGAEIPGVINDITVGDDFAIAVGMTDVDGETASLLMIRRDGQWSSLISPIDGVEFLGATIAGDQIIAVGQENPASPVPIAIVANSSGEGLSHSLPIRSAERGGNDIEGVARSVTMLSDGTIVAIGDVGRSADAEVERGGAIWEYLPDATPIPAWTTRASNDLLDAGYAELWTIDEFQGQTYIFGRSETEDGRRNVGAWLLN